MWSLTNSLHSRGQRSQKTVGNGVSVSYGTISEEHPKLGSCYEGVLMLYKLGPIVSEI